MGVAIFFQRRRKLLLRLGALLILGAGGLLAVLPRADAHDVTVQPVEPKVSLLSPAPLSGRQFSTFYPLAHR
ncbi:MAG: hypothetical protein ABIQ30_06435 [Devosia sp.]